MTKELERDENIKRYMIRTIKRAKEHLQYIEDCIERSDSDAYALQNADAMMKWLEDDVVDLKETLPYI